MRCSISLIIILAFSFLTTRGQNNFQNGKISVKQVRKVESQPLPPFASDVYVFNLNHPDENYQAALLAGKTDYSLQLYLGTSGGRKLFQIKIPSENIVFGRELIVISGKKANQNHLDHDVPEPMKGIYAFDYSGQLVYSFQETGTLKHFTLLRNDLLLFNGSGGFVCIDKTGSRLWQNKWNPVNYSGSVNGDFVFVNFINDDGITFTTSLVESRTGNVLSSTRYTEETEIMLLHADADAKHLVYSVYSEKNSVPAWTIEIKDLATLNVIYQSPQISEGPYSVSYNAEKNSYGLLMAAPNAGNYQLPGQLFIGEWQLSDNTIIKEGLPSNDYNFDFDMISYDRLNDQYLLRHGKTNLIFTVQ